MKRLTQIFQALLGVVALILTALVAAGRLAWRTIRNWWKSRSKWIRRTACSTLTFVWVAFLAIVGYAWWMDCRGRDYWDRTLSDHITLRSFADNKWRVYDNKANKYTTDRINWLVEGLDSLAVYAQSGKRGYINVHTGRIAIDASANEYSRAWIFSEGVAAVEKDGMIGFINAQNEVVIPFQFEGTSKCSMIDLGYAFHNGLCVMTNANGDLGLIDTAGRWAVEPTYDEIWSPQASGYRIAIKDGRYGVLDSEGVLAIPIKYCHIRITSDGFVLTKDGAKWQEDFAGNTVIPFMFDNTTHLNYPIDTDEYGDVCYALSDYLKYEVQGRYGIMNRLTGEPITPALYSTINMLSAHLFEVQEYCDFDWYLIDAMGNVASKK